LRKDRRPRKIQTIPFRGSKAMLLFQVLSEEQRRPRKRNEKIPRDLGTIALKALAKEPGRRYATARELADDLRRWLKGEPVLARPGPRRETSCSRTPFPRCNRRCSGDCKGENSAGNDCG